MFRIKRITKADKPRAYVTIEEVDAQGDISGRVWTEPFDTLKKDWAELKKRFEARIKEDDDDAVVAATLIEEANNAGITSIS